MTSVVLTDADVQRIARATVDLLRLEDAAPRDLLTSAEVAARFGVSAAWVRERADQLGAIRLGTGSRPRLRFDPEVVRDFLRRKNLRPAGSPGSAGRTASSKPTTPGTGLDIRAPRAFDSRGTRDKLTPRRDNARGRDAGNPSPRRKTDRITDRSTPRALGPPGEEQA